METMMSKPAHDPAARSGVRPTGRRREAAESTLMAYFRDMTGTALLTAERETELAKEIEAREIDIWVALLSCPATVEHMLGRVEALLDNSMPEFRSVRGAATKAR